MGLNNYSESISMEIPQDVEQEEVNVVATDKEEVDGVTEK